MKIALLGYGKMGKLVEELALHQGWEVGPKLQSDTNPAGAGITEASMVGVDVAVDFSRANAVLANIEAAAQIGLNLVVGTTGWYDARSGVEKIVLQSGIGLLYAANFSIGVNLFFEIASHTAQVVRKLPQYDCFLAEEHHRSKKDAPSGTAMTLLELMRPYLNDPIPSVVSTRAGFTPGNHTLGFDSEADTILLEHRARSRQGFAEGALLGARWIAGKKGFYHFRDVFREILAL